MSVQPTKRPMRQSLNELSGQAVVTPADGDGKLGALVESYGDMLDDIRKVFASGCTKTYEWRKQQLYALQHMISDNHLLITEALKKDHAGSPIRSLAEMGSAAAADVAALNLKSWMLPKPVSHPESHIVGGKSIVRPEPKGVVLIISPWNFPFELCLHPLVAAISAGNCAVLKPSEVSPASSKLLAELIPKYMDTECIRVIEGEVTETTALLKQKWDHIFYTGNGTIGRIVAHAAADNLTPITLELGGKSPVIIDKSAQMDATVARISMAKLLNVGQICVAPDYVFCDETLVDEFIARMKSTITKAYGPDFKTNESYGRIINARHCARLKRLIETSGGVVELGGADQVDIKDRYVPPTIIRAPADDAPILKEEIFGPVLPIVPVKSLDEAIQRVQANVREFGTPLALSVYGNKAAAKRVLQAIPSGGATVNTSMEQVVGHTLPFGGVGESGMGCYHGKYGFDELSHHRAIVYKSTMPGLRASMQPLPPYPKKMYDIGLKVMFTGFFTPEQREVVRRFRLMGCIAVACVVTGLVLARLVELFEEL